jgi:hypothetical protein
METQFLDHENYKHDRKLQTRQKTGDLRHLPFWKCNNDNFTGEDRSLSTLGKLSGKHQTYIPIFILHTHEQTHAQHPRAWLYKTLS